MAEQSRPMRRWGLGRIGPRRIRGHLTTAIWQSDGTGWRLLGPTGFPDEQALHGLVEEAPQILPLASRPRLTVVGREVLFGGNYADLIAVEPSGRVAVIEIKLRRNAEARRAVVAQVLTYAAYLRGLEVDRLGPRRPRPTW